MTVAEITPHRRPIASRSRALAIVELVAAKHGIDVHTLHAGGLNRFVVEARGEAVFELTHKLGWSTRRVGAHFGCSAPNDCKLLGLHKMNLERGGRFMPMADIRPARAVDSEAPKLNGIGSTYRAVH